MRAAFGRRYEHYGWLGCLYEGFSSDGKVKKTTRSLTRMVEAGEGRLSSDCSAEVFWKRVGLRQLLRPMVTPEASNTGGIIQLRCGNDSNRWKIPQTRNGQQNEEIGNCYQSKEKSCCHFVSIERRRCVSLMLIARIRVRIPPSPKASLQI